MKHGDLVWCTVPLWGEDDLKVKAIFIGKQPNDEYIIELENGERLSVTEDLVSKREKE